MTVLRNICMYVYILLHPLPQFRPSQEYPDIPARKVCWSEEHCWAIPPTRAEVEDNKEQLLWHATQHACICHGLPQIEMYAFARPYVFQNMLCGSWTTCVALGKFVIPWIYLWALTALEVSIWGTVCGSRRDHWVEGNSLFCQEVLNLIILLYRRHVIVVQPPVVCIRMPGPQRDCSRRREGVQHFEGALRGVWRRAVKGTCHSSLRQWPGWLLLLHRQCRALLRSCSNRQHQTSSRREGFKRNLDRERCTAQDVSGKAREPRGKPSTWWFEADRKVQPDGGVQVLVDCMVNGSDQN